MPIVTADVPITAERNNELIQKIVQTYPFCRTELIGTTAFGTISVELV